MLLPYELPLLQYLKELPVNAGIVGLNLSGLLTGNAPPVEMGDIKMIRLFVALMLMMGNVNAASFKVASDGPVNAFYAGSSAGYESTMFALIGDGSPLQSFDVFSNKSSSIGDFKNLGYFHQNDYFVPVLHVANTGYFYSSFANSNLDNLNHIFASQFSLPDSTPAVFIGFEDIYGLGDRDFDDNMVIFTNVMMAPVPEPSTYAMLLLGLGLLGFMVRRTK